MWWNKARDYLKWYTVYSANYIFVSLILMQGGRDPDGPVDREKARKDAQV